MPKNIKTKQFILRPFRMGDAKSVIKYAGDKLIARNLPNLPHPYTKKDAKWWLTRQINFRRQKNPEEVVFAIEINGEAVGSIGLHKINYKHKAELGYWLGREYWGRGIMTNVVKKVVNFGFRDLKLNRIYARVFLSNKGSARVLEKNRFKCEGIANKDIKKGNKFVDAYIFAKIKKE